MMKKVEIFTDGACRGNPGPGGWGAILRSGDVEKELSGGEAHTTNNRMEMMAAIKALEALKYRCEVNLYTDSTYVKDGITKWIHGWKKKNRLVEKENSENGLKNIDLWLLLDRVNQQHQVTWHWVRGHNGHPENERVDELARMAIDKGDS